MASYSGGRSVSLGLSDVLTRLDSTRDRGRNRVIATNSTQVASGNQLPVEDPERGLGQKLDRLIALCVENKSSIETIKRDSETTKQDLSSLTAEISGVKAQLQSAEQNKNAGKKRRIIPTALSNAVRVLHDKASNQFYAREPFGSEHNQSVKAYLVECMEEKFVNAHSPRRIRKAVHRYYESRRRLFNDSKPERKEKVQEGKRKCKKKMLRKRLYEQRRKYVKHEKERKLFEELNHLYMTEESEREDVIYRHPLSWRSPGLNKLISKLDRRRTRKGQKLGTFVAKERMESIQSTLSPPKNAPRWTVSSEYATPRSATGSSTGGLSSHTPSSAEQLIIDRHGSSGSGSSYTTVTSPASSMSAGSTPLQTPSTSSRPRNLLGDLTLPTQRSGDATRSEPGEDDPFETFSDGSCSSLDSSDVDY